MHIDKDSDNASSSTYEENPTTNDRPQKHPIFWFDDGSVVLRAQDQLFKVHRTLITRLSPFLFSLIEAFRRDSINSSNGAKDIGLFLQGCDYVVVDPARQVLAGDVDVLLQHLYHDTLLSVDTPFPRVASILRVTSPLQLNFPSIHVQAIQRLERLFPGRPIPFSYPDYLEEALHLATEYQISSIQKVLFYSLVTTSNFDTEGDAEPPNDGTAPQAKLSLAAPVSELESDTPVEPDDTRTSQRLLSDSSSAQDQARRRILSKANAKRCTQLMTRIIDYFTPTLFTPAATPHMACTDVFADKWMPLVIQPALADDGVYKPLETLERIKVIDWALEGLCLSCVEEKREEWTNEQEVVWKLMDEWLELISIAVTM